MAIFRFPWADHDNQIWIVDCGSKSTDKIAHQARNAGFRSRVLDWKALPQNNTAQYPKALILSGSGASIHDPGAPRVSEKFVREVLARGGFVIGICFGAQDLADKFGGLVNRAPRAESGIVPVKIHPLYQKYLGNYRGGKGVVNHWDDVKRLPIGWECFASTPQSFYAMFGTSKIFCTLVHIEMDHTEDGADLLRHLLINKAGCTPDYSFSPNQFIEEAGQFLKEKAGNKKIIMGLSGGVDSSVSYTIADRKLGSGRVKGVYIDTELIREGETAWAQKMFQGKNVRFADARAYFLRAILAVPYKSLETEPEYFKNIRIAIRKCFADVFVSIAREEGAQVLGQGTNLADVLETRQGFKEHHNMLETLAETIGIDVVDILSGLFKVEIRKVAAALGLPLEIVRRQPNPGPGNAIRMWGPVTKEKLRILAQANRIMEEVVAKHYPDFDERPSQYYVGFMPLTASCLIGDERVDGYILYWRAVRSGDDESYITLDRFRFSEACEDELTWRLRTEVQPRDGKPIGEIVESKLPKPPRATEIW